eukprot:gene22793-biopygen19282
MAICSKAGIGRDIAVGTFRAIVCAHYVKHFPVQPVRLARLRAGASGRPCSCNWRACALAPPGPCSTGALARWRLGVHVRLARLRAGASGRPCSCDWRACALAPPGVHVHVTGALARWRLGVHVRLARLRAGASASMFDCRACALAPSGVHAIHRSCRARW